MEFSHQKGKETLGFCPWILSEVLRKCPFKTRVFDRKLFSTHFSLHGKDRGSLGKAVNIGPHFWFFHTYSRVLKSPVVAQHLYLTTVRSCKYPSKMSRRSLYFLVITIKFQMYQLEFQRLKFHQGNVTGLIKNSEANHYGPSLDIFLLPILSFTQSKNCSKKEIATV